MDPTELDVLGLVELIASNKISAVEATNAYLRRIEEMNPSLKAYITVAEASAQAEAEASDRRRARGAARGMLDGIPIALKDNIDVAGLPTTAGIGAYRSRIPEGDAFAVERLRAAGVVVLGKLNMPEGALGGTTDNSWFGRCENPHRAGFTPGGSSGGAGAAVVAGLCAAALGTDTMGSVRLPASYCGVVGLKPTFGLISTGGVVPLCWRLDHVGVLTRSVRDAGALLWILAAFDRHSPESLAVKPPDFAVPENPEVSGMVLGRVRLDGLTEVDSEIDSACDEALRVLTDCGCEVRDVEIRSWNPGRSRRAGLLISEADGYVVHEEALQADPGGFSNPFRSLLHYGRDCGAVRLVKAKRLVAEAGLAALQALETVDVLAMPTTPQTAFPHSEQAPTNQADLTALANFAEIPAISIPNGFSQAGLPIGMQFLASPLNEQRLLHISRAYERAAGWDLGVRGSAG